MIRYMSSGILVYQLSKQQIYRTLSSLTSNTSSKAQSEVKMQEPKLKNQEKMPFSGQQIGEFFQAQPNLGNQFAEDTFLQDTLKRLMPNKVYEAVNPDLTKFGHRVATDIMKLGEQCEKEQPRLIQYDAWGKRVDKIVTCQAWRDLHDVSATEGLIAIPYERQYAQWSRLYQMAKLYLFNPSGGLYPCPLAMTDGAARSIEALDLKGNLGEAFSHLTSRDPKRFWTSGQWMTERKGGSDVGEGTETLAVAQDDGTYRLYGYKWFTSATDSDMALTLARIVDDDGQPTPGSKGLSMFYLELRDKDGNLQNISIQRLKDKLGTRQLPTAELLLTGIPAIKVSDEGRGVATISHMLTITRIYNSISAVAGMRRIVALARDFSTKRRAFGKLICDHSLHMQTLSRMEVETRAALGLVFEMVRLLGLEETGIATEQQRLLLRFLTPMAKLYTAKQGVAVASEGLECFGGQGYMEDTGIPALLRDAQVLPIWEGTTNILSMDILRALMKSSGESLEVYANEIQTKLQSGASVQSLSGPSSRVSCALSSLGTFIMGSQDKLEMAARDLAYSLARTYMGACLIEHAAWSNCEEDITVATRWCNQELDLVTVGNNNGCYSNNSSALDRSIVMAGYTQNKL
ncbi:unnamed protein product [Owenia fusiformis]|uniref:Uncharacterized protein n=1 Tax=Owenia fusiformis TaxID=6347 RepID=A0A8J1TME3_OWEFU|nr:unnamed protein product [Owenia fusiformis]